MAQINQPGFTENRAQVRESSTTLNIIPGCARSDPIDSRNLFLWRAAVMDLSPDSGDNLTGHSFRGRRVGIRFWPRDKEVDQIWFFHQSKGGPTSNVLSFIKMSVWKLCVNVKQQVGELVIVGKEMFGPWPTPDPLLSWVEPKTAASMPPVTGLHSTYTDTQTCFKVHKDPHKWCLACKTTLMIIWVEQQVQVQTSHLFCSWTWHSAPL